MLTTPQLLDAAKSKQGISSDYKLSLLLDITTGGVGNYRHGRSIPDDSMAERLADLAGIDRGYVLVCLHAERAKEDSVRSTWRTVADRLAHAAAVAAVAFVTFGGPPDAGASVPSVEPAGDPASTKQEQGAVCILCQIKQAHGGQLVTSSSAPNMRSPVLKTARLARN